MIKSVHEFDNGVKVYEYHLLDIQKERYATNNVHEEDEEPVFLEMLSKIKEGGTYVNVGAAIGYYPLLAASTRSDLNIVVYEPLAVHRKYFCENITLNGYEISGFKIYKEGVYRREGDVSFSVMHYGSMIKEDERKKNFFQKFLERLTNSRVDCVTLEGVSNREKNDIDFLQMDIQGLELDVLNAAEKVLLQHKIKRFLIGTHSESIHRNCTNILIRNGYRILYDVYETKHQPDGILLAEIE